MSTRSADAFDWLIAVPCWGASYREKFLIGILPSINAALSEIKGKVRFIIHTDEREAFFNAKFSGSLDLRAQPEGVCLYTAFGNAHRDALKSALSGECVCFLTSDIVVSKECFLNAEKRFREGKRAILTTIARTISKPEDCPSGMASRDLLEWSFNREHDVTKGCYYEKGTNVVGWCTYFEGVHGTVAHCFHTHPFCVLNDRPLSFPITDTTIDLSFIETCFDRSEIHVITDPDESSFAEISGDEKQPISGNVVGVGSIVSWAMHNTTDFQRWISTHRIVVRGTGEDHLDEEIWREVLSILG